MFLPLSSLMLLALPAAGPTAAADPPPADPAAGLAAFWAEAARTVRDGDYAGYAALYHPDAVFVSDVKGTVSPIAEQLAVWKPGFEATKAGETAATVEFRFSQRLHGPTTAHETGLFRYVSRPADERGAGEPAVVRFEALLVRGPDGWRWVMERQLSRATEQEWAALAPPAGGAERGAGGAEFSGSAD